MHADRLGALLYRPLPDWLQYMVLVHRGLFRVIYGSWRLRGVKQSMKLPAESESIIATSTKAECII